MQVLVSYFFTCETSRWFSLSHVSLMAALRSKRRASCSSFSWRMSSVLSASSRSCSAFSSRSHAWKTQTKLSKDWLFHAFLVKIFLFSQAIFSKTINAMMVWVRRIHTMILTPPYFAIGGKNLTSVMKLLKKLNRNLFYNCCAPFVCLFALFFQIEFVVLHPSNRSCDLNWCSLNFLFKSQRFSSS